MKDPMDFEGFAQRLTLSLIATRESEWPEVLENVLRQVYATAIRDSEVTMERVLERRALGIERRAEDMLTPREKRIRRALAQPTNGVN